MKTFYYTDSEGNKVCVPNYRVDTDTISELTLGLQGKVNRSEHLSHTQDYNNPHSVTKAQVGLGLVDNTSDANKPVSTYQQEALNKKENTGNKTTEISEDSTDTQYPSAKAVYTIITENEKTTALAWSQLNTDIQTHTGSSDNPHGVTKSQVGLGNVDNTSDANKPISTLQQQALDKKVDKTTTVNGHALDSNVTVTKSDIDLGNVDNTSDANKPVSTAQQTALDKKVDKVTGSNLVSDTKITSYDNHLTNTANPHGVTKSQVGLGNVTNTGDSATPVSGGTTKFTTGGAYAELAKKVDKVDGKGLSTNDYTTEDKTLLSNLESRVAALEKILEAIDGSTLIIKD